jgi:hypothetical protein
MPVWVWQGKHGVSPGDKHTWQSLDAALAQLTSVPPSEHYRPLRAGAW